MVLVRTLNDPFSKRKHCIYFCQYVNENVEQRKQLKNKITDLNKFGTYENKVENEF